VNAVAVRLGSEETFEALWAGPHEDPGVEEFEESLDCAVRELQVVQPERLLVADGDGADDRMGEFDRLLAALADFAFAADRALARLVGTRAAVAVVNTSGSVGTGLGLPPALVRDVADTLDLGVAPVTTQVVFRDAIAAWVTDLALLGAVCEAVATDFRLGQHDGVAELAEPWQVGQEGSSAMPHKRNPITAENITGLARLLRGYVGPVLEDVALWQHRDISHSSVERVVLPDAAALCERALTATARMVKGVIVAEDALQANIDRAGAALASSRLQARLQSTGLRRQDAADAVRERVSGGLVTTEEVESAATQVLRSEALAATFDRLIELRAHYASPR
jgi:adenylosuccinate lyase